MKGKNGIRKIAIPLMNSQFCFSHPPATMDDTELPAKPKRRTFVWSAKATELLDQFFAAQFGKSVGQDAVLRLATKLAGITGNPRDACLRLIRRRGIAPKRSRRPWTIVEQQKLVDLVEEHTIDEIAVMLRRTPMAIRIRLHHLGESSQRGREWFTSYSLSAVLHVGVGEVRRWIKNGWLKSRIVESMNIRKEVIDPDDFNEFVKKYGRGVVGRRLTAEGLAFVQNFVFPPKHAHLLPLRGPRDQQQLPTDEAQGDDDEEANDLDESA